MARSVSGLRGSGASSMSSAWSPSGKYAFEFGRGARDGIVGNDQAINGRVGRESQGTVDTRRGQEYKGADDPEPRAQHAEENLMHEQGSHSINGCARRA